MHRTVSLTLFTAFITDGIKIKHGDVTECIIKRETGLVGQQYDVCVNGCKLFGPKSKEEVCPYCDAGVASRKKMTLLSVGDQIARLLADDVRRQELRYRADRVSVPGVYKDFFDGEAYKEFKERGEFQNPDDVAIALFTDGFVNQKQNSNLFTMVHAIILNYDPSNR